MPGIKPECRSRHLTARWIRRHGRLATRPRRGQYAALLPRREWCRPEHLETPARHVYRTGAANGGTGPGMEWSWVLCPCGRAERKPVRDCVQPTPGSMIVLGPG